MLEQLRGIGEVAAVHGNADDAAVRSLLPTRLELTVGDVRLGIVHDAGAARGRLERLRRSFTEANAVIFGEPLGGLCDGEQSALAEPVAVAGEAVVLAEPDDAQSGEPEDERFLQVARAKPVCGSGPGATHAGANPESAPPNVTRREPPELERRSSGRHDRILRGELAQRLLVARLDNRQAVRVLVGKDWSEHDHVATPEVRSPVGSVPVHDLPLRVGQGLCEVRARSNEAQDERWA